MGSAFEYYFSTLFSTGQEVELGPCLQHLEAKVSGSINKELMQEFSAEEINIALYQMALFKALGSNGLNAYFFSKKLKSHGIRGMQRFWVFSILD